MTSTTAALPAGNEIAQGPKPQRVSPARMGVYGFLIIAALFFLFPLYVMVVTSLKTMPEIRLGHLFNLPQTSGPSSRGSMPGCTPARAWPATGCIPASGIR